MKIQIINANVYNCFLKNFEKKYVFIENGKFRYIDDMIHEHDVLIDAQGQYMIPGFVDIHMHIESSMTTPTIFSSAVLVNGTTTVVADCHEIGNVFGVDGLNNFMNAETILDIFYAIPSSVPSSSTALETTGGLIEVEQVQQLLENPKVIALGEVMNFNDTVNDEDTLIKRIIKTVKDYPGFKPIEGHCSRYQLHDVQDFLYQGVTSCHTDQNEEGLYNKLSNGMFIQLQEKTVKKEFIDIINQHQFFDYVSLVTDDVMPHDLRNDHLNKVVNVAIECGMDPRMAIYCASFTAARRMHLEDRGAIAPGRIADFMFTNSITTIKPTSVYKNGELVANNGKMVKKEKPTTYPEHYYHSIQCPKATLDDFIIKTDKINPQCNIMEILEHTTKTNHLIQEVSTKNGILDYQGNNLNLIKVFNRYSNQNESGYTLAKTKFHNGAVATTWAHDHHNLMVMGDNPNDMMIAQHALIDSQGGMVVVSEGKILAHCPLTIAGIVSDEPIEVIGAGIDSIKQAMNHLGYYHFNEIMSFATLSLLCSPSLKISDKGLVDVYQQKVINCIIK